MSASPGLSLVVEVKNRLLFPFIEPPVPECFAVKATDLSVAFEPCVVLASGQLFPFEQVFAWQFGTLRPTLRLVNAHGDPLMDLRRLDRKLLGD